MGALNSKLSLGSLCSKLGSLCSKPSNHQGGHSVLSESANPEGPPRDLQAAALRAAEQRRQEDRNRGTLASNPKSGQLSRKLEERNRGVTPQEMPAPVIYE